MSVRERMEEAMNQTAGAPEGGWKDSTLFKDLGMDSLDATEMIMEIEEEFNISISEDEVEGLLIAGNVADLERLVEEKL